MSLVTRILTARCESQTQINQVCGVIGFMRADIWRRYGALGNMGKNATVIRKEITERGFYADLLVDGTIRAETTKDVVNDILTYKAAALRLVRQSINKHTSDKEEQRRLYSLLKQDKWLEDRYLHRMVRKHFRHGVSHTDNQFIVRADRHTEAVIDGKLTITIQIAKKFGEHLVLTTNSNGKNVNLSGKNLRIIVKNKCIEIHYASEKQAKKPCGTQETGVDKGYTEAFVDSDGEVYGDQFGKVMREYSDQISKTGVARNKLHALEKKHREAGRIAKADNIKRNNLGRVKLEARKDRVQSQLRTIAYQSVHKLVDKSAVIGSEDLTSRIKNKQDSWRTYNRRMSAWAKGVLAQALEEVCDQRGAMNIIVNAAYTSQMDSETGLLQGKRVGDKFYRTNGDVLQADLNAARNVKARLHDAEISRYMPYKQVKAILLSRSSDATERQGALVGSQDVNKVRINPLAQL